MEDDSLINLAVNLSIAVYMLIMVVWGCISAIRILALLHTFRKAIIVNLARSPWVQRSMRGGEKEEEEGNRMRKRGGRGWKIPGDDVLSVITPSEGSGDASGSGERRRRRRRKVHALSSKAVESSNMLLRAIKKVAVTLIASLLIAITILTAVGLEMALQLYPHVTAWGYYTFMLVIHVVAEGGASLVLTYSSHQRPEVRRRGRRSLKEGRGGGGGK